MLIHRAVKTKLKLTEDQRKELIRWGGAARYVYNWALAQRMEYYEEYSIGITYAQQNKQLTLLKKEHSWLADHISKWILQDSLRKLDVAFTNFFRNINNKKSGKKGYPQFKKKYQQNDSFTIQAFSGTQKLIYRLSTQYMLGMIV